MSVCSVTCCRDVLAFSEEDPLQREETQGECAGLLPENGWRKQVQQLVDDTSEFARPLCWIKFVPVQYVLV